MTRLICHESIGLGFISKRIEATIAIMTTFISDINPNFDGEGEYHVMNSIRPDKTKSRIPKLSQKPMSGKCAP